MITATAVTIAAIVGAHAAGTENAATMTATADGSDRATDMTTTEARAETDQEKGRGRETDL
ncbi:hypothetical protein KC353_g18851, partial [Hortaea werneckii]